MFCKGSHAPADTLRLAVQTRRLAERAALGLSGEYADASRGEGYHPFSEFVLPWIASRVETGDRGRRDGQDLLFSSVKADWDSASDLIGKARQEYEAAQKTAASIRAGFDLRTEVMARLPFYSLWLGGRLGDERSQQDDLAPLEDLWQDVHALKRPVGIHAPGHPGG